MKTYQKISSETNGKDPIIISAGRTVYTDAGGAEISYVIDGETETKTLSFAKNTNYEFLKNTTVRVTDGNLYLFKESQEIKTLDMGELKGIPIPPETKLELTNANSKIAFTYYDGSSMTLDGPGTYQYYPL